MNHLNDWQLGLTFLGVTCGKYQYKLEPTHPIHYQLKIRELIKSRLPSDEKTMEEVSKIINSNTIINEFTYLNEGFYNDKYEKFNFKMIYDYGRRIFYNSNADCNPF